MKEILNVKSVKYQIEKNVCNRFDKYFPSLNFPDYKIRKYRIRIIWLENQGQIHVLIPSIYIYSRRFLLIKKH